MNILVKPATDDDCAAVLALNEAALPHVSSIEREELDAIVAESLAFNLVTVDGEIAGFMLALREGAGYQSPNYRWFAERYPVFAYVDRIVISPSFSRLGLGAKLYGRLERIVTDQVPILACEVNLRPANPGSIAFHQSIGFSEVGQQETGKGEKRVSLMIKELH